MTLAGASLERGCTRNLERGQAWVHATLLTPWRYRRSDVVSASVRLCSNFTSSTTPVDFTSATTRLHRQTTMLP